MFSCRLPFFDARCLGVREAAFAFSAKSAFFGVANQKKKKPMLVTREKPNCILMVLSMLRAFRFPVLSCGRKKRQSREANEEKNKCLFQREDVISVPNSD